MVPLLLAIRVAGIHKSFTGRMVLKGIDLEVGDGELHIVLGPNGSGKTTLVKIIAGLLQMDEGRVIIDGVDVSGKPPPERGVGVVLQGSPLLPLRTVYDHIAFPLRARGINMGIDGMVRDVAGKLGLMHKLHRSLYELSGGERQRVSIATALVGGLRNLVLDEPFSSLDPEYRIELYNLLSRLRGEGLSILVTTHIVDDLIYMADRIWILVDGIIEESGSPEDLLSNPKSSYAGKVLKPPYSSIVDCKSASWACSGGKAIIPYYMVEAVESSGGDGIVHSIISFNGSRIAVVETGYGIIYAIPGPGVVKGARVSVKPRSWRRSNEL